MPYEEETLVEHRGRMVTEIVSAGRLRRHPAAGEPDQGQPRPRRARARSARRRLHPSREEGLVAEIRISPHRARRRDADAGRRRRPRRLRRVPADAGRREVGDALAPADRARPGSAISRCRRSPPTRAPASSLSAQRRRSRRGERGADAEPRPGARLAAAGGVRPARPVRLAASTELPPVVDHWARPGVAGDVRPGESSQLRNVGGSPHASHRSDARPHLGEIEEKQTFIDGVVEAAEKEGRDLTAQEMELVTRSRDRQGELNEQAKPMQEAARIAARVGASGSPQIGKLMSEQPSEKPKRGRVPLRRRLHPRLLEGGARRRGAARAARAVPAGRRPPDDRRQPGPAADADRAAGHQLHRHRAGRSSTWLGPAPDPVEPVGRGRR